MWLFVMESTAVVRGGSCKSERLLPVTESEVVVCVADFAQTPCERLVSVAGVMLFVTESKVFARGWAAQLRCQRLLFVM